MPASSLPRVLTSDRRVWLRTQLAALRARPDAIRQANALIQGEFFGGHATGDELRAFWDANDLGGAS